MLHFISPPRPKDKIHPRQLPSIEKEGRFFAQPKYDGDRCGIPIKGQELQFYERHGRLMKIDRSLRSKLTKEVLSLDLGVGLHYLDCEFLPQVGCIALYDLLYHVRPMVGVGQMDRLAELEKICRFPQTTSFSGLARPVTEHIWLAPVFMDRFREHYATTLSLQEIVEGLLLRRKDSYLEQMGGGGEYEVSWQVRCRQGRKNYRC